jgi:hypothetical protein
MRRLPVVALLLPSLLISSSDFASPKKLISERPDALVRAAMVKMGGEERLRSIKALQIDGIGHTYYIEQSERPEGPWIADYTQITELRDYINSRFSRTVQHRDIQSESWSPQPTLVVADGVAAISAGGRTIPGSSTRLAEAEEALALSPERVLLTAIEARDLHIENDSLMQGVAQHVVGFTWRDAAVRVYLSAQTEMPTAIEYVRSYLGSIFWSVWGDVKTRVYLSLWNLEPGGLRYPCQWNVERNGTPYQEFTITSLRIDPPLDEKAFSISAEIHRAYETNSRQTINDLPLGRPDSPPMEMAPGVVMIPGRWNVTLVRQQDGLVIIEAPISSGYSGKLIAEAQKRFPGAPIKAVISTSDAWPHIGGVREYVAREVPIYALDLNRPILERLILSPHHANPDALERAPRKPRFHIVSSKTALGSGPNRMELYPVRTETGERMIMVYLPEHKLLYGSDLLQRLPDGSFFMPEYVLELMEAVQRERLTVDRAFAMHMVVKPWTEMEAAVAKAKAAGQQTH